MLGSRAHGSVRGCRRHVGESARDRPSASLTPVPGDRRPGFLPFGPADPAVAGGTSGPGARCRSSVLESYRSEHVRECVFSVLSCSLQTYTTLHGSLPPFGSISFVLYPSSVMPLQFPNVLASPAPSPASLLAAGTPSCCSFLHPSASRPRGFANISRAMGNQTWASFSVLPFLGASTLQAVCLRGHEF